MHNFTILRENFYDSSRKRGCPLYISFPFFARLSMQGIISNVSSWEIRKVKAKYGLVKAFTITSYVHPMLLCVLPLAEEAATVWPLAAFLDIAVAPLPFLPTCFAFFYNTLLCCHQSLTRVTVSVFLTIVNLFALKSQVSLSHVFSGRSRGTVFDMQYLIFCVLQILLSTKFSISPFKSAAVRSYLVRCGESTKWRFCI